MIDDSGEIKRGAAVDLQCPARFRFDGRLRASRAAPLGGMLSFPVGKSYPGR
jgi:hypothetical protein